MTSESIRAFIDSAKCNRFHIGLLICCTFIVITEGYDLVVYGSVMPLLMKEWSLSPLQAGIIGSYGLFGMMFGVFVLGYLADRFGRKKILLVCVILFSTFTALAGFAESPAAFSAYRFLAGIGFGGALPSALALMTDYAPKMYRNRLIPIVPCGMQIGGVLAPFVSMGMFDEYGWRSVLWLGALPLLLLPVLYKVMPESTSHLLAKGKTDALLAVLQKANPTGSLQLLQGDAKSESQKTQRVPVAMVFENKRGISTVMFWISAFMCLLMIYGLNTWLPNLMVNAGQTLQSSLLTLIILNAAAVIGTFIFGGIADRWNPKKLLVVLYSLAPVSLVLLGFSNNAVVLYGLIAITGACTMGTQNMFGSFVTQFYPAKIRSTGIGLTNAVGRIGGIVGPTLGGILLTMKLPIYLNFIAFAIPGVIAAIAFLFVRETREANSRHELVATE